MVNHLANPAITRTFLALYQGLFYVTVKVDVDDGVDEEDGRTIMRKTSQSLFSG